MEGENGIPKISSRIGGAASCRRATVQSLGTRDSLPLFVQVAALILTCGSRSFDAFSNRRTSYRPCSLLLMGLRGLKTASSRSCRGFFLAMKRCVFRWCWGAVGWAGLATMVAKVVVGLPRDLCLPLERLLAVARAAGGGEP